FAVFAAVRPQPEPSITQPLDSLIPRDLPGWTVKDLPLAETEELRGRVEEILDFDDYVSRVYTRGSTQLILYIAYWKPASTTMVNVQKHTPDSCWVLNGWEKTEAEEPINIGEVMARHPSQYRIFEKNGQEQSVVFWHVIGDRGFIQPEDKGFGYLTWHYLTEFGTSQKAEQFFVRISSNREIRNVLKDPSTYPLLSILDDIM
ncbi:MAG: exosortase-associated EpsI family protein, partial [Opitutales bacterium]|nr:exosortase-associated EpsI family protein [Opitutales bacterium]